MSDDNATDPRREVQIPPPSDEENIRSPLGCQPSTSAITENNPIQHKTPKKTTFSSTPIYFDSSDEEVEHNNRTEHICIVHTSPSGSESSNTRVHAPSRGAWDILDMDEIVTDYHMERQQGQDSSFASRMAPGSTAAANARLAVQPDPETPEHRSLRLKSVWRLLLYVVAMYITYAVTYDNTWPSIKMVNPSCSTSLYKWAEFIFYIGKLFYLLLDWMVPIPVQFDSASLMYKALLLPAGGVLHVAALTAHYPNMGEFLLFLSRFLLGISSGQILLIMRYIAYATMPTERGKYLGLVLAAAALGSALGLGVQALIVYGKESSKFVLDLGVFRAASFICIIIGLIAIAIPEKKYVYSVRPWEEASMFIQNINGGFTDFDHVLKLPVFATLCLGIFTLQLLPLVIETFTSQSTRDLFAWRGDMAVFRIGLIPVGSVCFLAIIFPIAGAIIAKMTQVRRALIGSLVYAFIAITSFVCQGTTSSDKYSPEEVHAIRCELDQPWCNWFRYIPFHPMIFYAGSITAAYAVGVIACLVILTKSVGPDELLDFLAYFMITECVAEMAAPLLVKVIYHLYGPRYLLIPLGILVVIVVCACIKLGIKMVPNIDIAAEYRRHMVIDSARSVALCTEYHRILTDYPFEAPLIEQTEDNETPNPPLVY